MFIDSIENIEDIASRNGTSIFVVPRDVKVEIKNALILAPEDKATITVEQTREILQRLTVRQTHEQFVVVRPAEALGLEAANAMLKTLEEPGEKVHFVLITDAPSALLSTILSRAAIYMLRRPSALETGLTAPLKVKNLAKKLLVARPADLPALADEITEKKDGARAFALEVVGTAIEMLYKSYFITEKEAFVRKLPKFLACYEVLSQNGHVKLQLVANLM